MIARKLRLLIDVGVKTWNCEGTGGDQFMKVYTSAWPGRTADDEFGCHGDTPTATAFSFSDAVEKKFGRSTPVFVVRPGNGGKSIADKGGDWDIIESDW
jgi:hypothetical protein